MGFTPPATVYLLDFADTDLDGLEVRAAGVPVGTLLEMASLADVADTGQVDTSAALAAYGSLLDGFAAVLRSWNLTDHHGQDVPATVEGLRTLEMRHVLAVVSAWIRAASAVPAPLDGPSDGGSPSVEASIPMGVPSVSLAS